jgi:penicillin-binding protein 2
MIELAKTEDPFLKARFSRRAALLGIGQAGLLGLLGHRLWQLQVRDSEHYKELAPGRRTSVQYFAPERGRILDRFGTVLAQSRQSQRVSIVPQLAGDVAEVLKRLAGIVELPNDEIDRILRLARSQNKRLPIVVAGDLSWEQVVQINVHAPHMPGLQTEAVYGRHYFHGLHMGQIVGYLGAPDRPSTTLETDPVLKVPGIKVGKAGAELGSDRQLRGEGGFVRLELEGRGRQVKRVEEKAARAGRDVVLTVDLDLQRRVLELIARHRRAAVVALDAQTGEIIVLASQPTFDNSVLAGAIGEAEWQALVNARDDPLTNRATRGAYPPGSTFKMVTALAGLESGVMRTGTTVTCEGSLEFADRHYGCWKRSGHGAVNLHRALKESCDVYFYETAKRVGIERLAPMARRLGFGQIFETGPALQKPGVVPDPDWKIATLERRWFPGETLHAAIGQGYMLATPLQLAVMTARLATGLAIEPRITRPEPDGLRTQAASLGLSAASLAAVRRGMIAVVNEDGGTATASALSLDGMQMAGKTGTSQVAGISRRIGIWNLPWHKRDHSLFVGYAPAKSPRYAVAAIVEHAGGGSKVAAPLVRQVMVELLTRDPLARPAYVLGVGAPARSDASARRS